MIGAYACVWVMLGGKPFSNIMAHHHALNHKIMPGNSQKIIHPTRNLLVWDY